MNEKRQRNDDLQERLIEFAFRVLDVAESLPISNPIPNGPLLSEARRRSFASSQMTPKPCWFLARMTTCWSN